MIRVNDENTSPVEIPATISSESLEVELGDQLFTSPQAASLCRMAALSDGSFHQGTRVTLVEGPRILENAWWWRVQSEKAAGWCPNTALVNVRGEF